MTVSPPADWTTSSYSQHQNCVQWRSPDDGDIRVADSKAGPDGRQIPVARTAWTAFVDGLKRA
ncbi:DUF397 domain-containing protein (plasmid) [Embleya sp. NBC_00888]|uniref:DUF397 domain-containing protein n=1 Tax=Embleya sp. NBC_00888 TaxID=2975960 RepID=UPI002F90E636|nr:DUF397 domain-containing protein [Embleya sp. NBC_00888]